MGKRKRRLAASSRQPEKKLKSSNVKLEKSEELFDLTEVKHVEEEIPEPEPVPPKKPNLRRLSKLKKSEELKPNSRKLSKLKKSEELKPNSRKLSKLKKSEELKPNSRKLSKLKKSEKLINITKVKNVEDDIPESELVPPKKPNLRHSNSGAWVVSHVIHESDPEDDVFGEMTDSPSADAGDSGTDFEEVNSGTDFEDLEKVDISLSQEDSAKRQEEDVNNNGNHIFADEKRNDDTKLHIFKIDKASSLVLLGETDVLVIHGKVQAQSVWGTGNCLGHTMTPGDTPCCIYSPDTAALMTISVISTVKLTAKQVIEKYPKMDKKCLRKSFETLGNSLCGIILKHFLCKNSKYITSISPFQSLYTGKILKLGMKWCKELLAFLAVNLPEAGIKFCDAHVHAVEQFVSLITNESSPVVVICGGKNIGKSTLGRYLVNSTLNKHEEIAYLDCDIGQTEFTPPGCISLTLVSQPLLGPAFTHLRKPERSCFVGLVSPSDNPAHYLKCLHYVYEAYKSLPGKRPALVVNTMGWVTGLGLNILAETLRMVKPDIVIQLAVSNLLTPPLNMVFVSTTPSFQAIQELSGTDPAYKVGEHKLIRIDVQPPGNRGMEKYRPAEQRTLALLAHFADIYCKSDSQNLGPIYKWPTYRRSWNSLALHVCHMDVLKSQMMYALNGSVVALCKADTKQMIVPRDEYLPKFFTKSPVCSCLGFGIVRAIDPESKLIHILTPVTPDDLVMVNCLLKGPLDLPESMIREQPAVSGTAFPPYVEFVSRHHGARFVKERHLMRKRHQTP